MNRTGRWRWTRLLGLLVSLGVPGLASAARGPAPVPPAWGAYAELVRQALPNWLADDTAANRRLAAYFESRRPDPASATDPIPLNIWLTPSGVVTRALFAEPAAAGHDADLTLSLAGRSLSAAPPADLRWPIRLALRVAPAPAEPSSPSP